MKCCDCKAEDFSEATKKLKGEGVRATARSVDSVKIWRDRRRSKLQTPGLRITRYKSEVTGQDTILQPSPKLALSSCSRLIIIQGEEILSLPVVTRSLFGYLMRLRANCARCNWMWQHAPARIFVSDASLAMYFVYPFLHRKNSLLVAEAHSPTKFRFHLYVCQYLAVQSLSNSIKLICNLIQTSEKSGRRDSKKDLNGYLCWSSVMSYNGKFLHAQNLCDSWNAPAPPPGAGLETFLAEKWDFALARRLVFACWGVPTNGWGGNTLSKVASKVPTNSSVVGHERANSKESLLI